MIILVAKVLVFYKDSDKLQLLLLKRASGAKVSPGMEDLPGGKAENMELMENAAIREVKEETGLSLKAIYPLTAHEWQHNSVKRIEHLFCTIVNAKEVTINSREHSNFRWISLEEIDLSDLHPTIKKIIHTQQDRIRKMRFHV